VAPLRSVTGVDNSVRNLCCGNDVDIFLSGFEMATRAEAA
jgi:hypothetical protein